MNIEIKLKLDLPPVRRYNTGEYSCKEKRLAVRMSDIDKHKIKLAATKHNTTVSALCKYILSEAIRELTRED